MPKQIKLSDEELDCLESEDDFEVEYPDIWSCGSESTWKEISYHKYTQGLLDYEYDPYSNGEWDEDKNR